MRAKNRDCVPTTFSVCAPPSKFPICAPKIECLFRKCPLQSLASATKAASSPKPRPIGRAFFPVGTTVIELNPARIYISSVLGSIFLLVQLQCQFCSAKMDLDDYYSVDLSRTITSAALVPSGGNALLLGPGEHVFAATCWLTRVSTQQRRPLAKKATEKFLKGDLFLFARPLLLSSIPFCEVGSWDTVCVKAHSTSPGHFL